METKKCPYCAEEIKSEAIKCKFCKSVLQQDENLSIKTGIQNRQKQLRNLIIIDFKDIYISLIIIVAGCLFFYFGSWHLIWNKEITLLDQIFSGNFSLTSQNFLFLQPEPGFVFKINNTYYGFGADKYFFDSPFIQWFMLSFSIVFVFEGLYLLSKTKINSILKYFIIIFICFILFCLSLDYKKNDTRESEETTTNNSESNDYSNKNEVPEVDTTSTTTKVLGFKDIIDFKIEQSVNEENFNTFINHFKSDSIFQKSRIKTPYIHIKGDEGFKETTKDLKWDLMSKEFIFQGTKKNNENIFLGEFTLNSSKRIFYNYGVPESDNGFRLVFEIINSKWMLVEYDE